MKRLLILCVSIMFLSCEPATKEAYLKHYAEFMSKVTTEASNYTEADWVRADEEFSQLSVTWYEQFESELSFAEELKLAGYQAKYAFYRGVSGVGPVLKEVMDSSDEIIQALHEISQKETGGMQSLSLKLMSILRLCRVKVGVTNA